MKERPILFNAPMVRALLDGSKTQTRRVMKPQPTHFNPVGVPRLAKPVGPNAIIACPYGQPGDRLWVRETWAQPDKRAACFSPWVYAADYRERPGHRWRPSIHMPRAASRITLEITGVRVERLQDITEADARSEGLNGIDFGDRARPDHSTAKFSFWNLWSQINGIDSWNANPWVWVVEFKLMEGGAA